MIEMKFKKRLKNFIKKTLLKQGFRIQNVQYFDFFDSLLHQLIKQNGTVSFVQIGANDGKRFDPVYEFVTIYENKVDGVLLEPVKEYYNDLVANYKPYKNIKTVNKAIHNHQNETTIYKVKKKYESELPELAKGIASFDSGHHKKTRIPSQYVEEESVKCITFSSLILEYNIQNADVLIIDTEGYDYHILNELNFNFFNPKVIHFEHGLQTGTMTKNQFNNIKNSLQNQNYQLMVNGSDATAYKLDIFFKFNEY